MENKKTNWSAIYKYIKEDCKFQDTKKAIFSADSILNNCNNGVDKNKIINFLDSILSDNLKYTSSIIKANEAIKKGDEKLWLENLNKYISGISKNNFELKSGNGNIFDRLKCSKGGDILDGDLVSIIMPAWNAEKTIKKSINSILNQTWKNIELIVVDDASEDNTWKILNEIVKKDSRVKILKNEKNLGPYVSKNIALKTARGVWVTGHDADDYALPGRIEEHVKEAVKNNYDASITYMIRMKPDGFFDHLGKITEFSFDGVARKASITCLFRREKLVGSLGFWDSVRYGADSEMIDRAEIILGDKFGVLKQISMICLSLEESLTNNRVTGVRTETGLSPVRVKYRESWMEWHRKISQGESAYIDFGAKNRNFEVPEEMDVSGLF